MKAQKRMLIIIILAVIGATVFAFSGRARIRPELTLELEKPSFVQAAAESGVESAPSEVRAMLSEEAGISAYKQTSGGINLNDVRGLFRTIETETSNYIIGSIQVPNYVEHFDVHVYVHVDGWILAYYLNDEITSKIIDTVAETIATTKLETALSTVAAAVGEPTTGMKYYDFRYPNATNILLIAENDDDGKDFTITLPSEYAYYERSWTTRKASGYSEKFYIDGVLQPTDYNSSTIAYGPIYSSTLTLDEPHNIEIGSYNYYGVLVITYRKP